jgi:hypothetical protein
MPVTRATRPAARLGEEHAEPGHHDGGDDRGGDVEPLQLHHAAEHMIGVGALGQKERVGGHHLGIAAEHIFAEADQEIGDAKGGHEQDDVGLVHQRPQHRAFDGEGEHEHDGDGERQRQEGVEAGIVQADQRQRGEHHHDALGEIEHAGGLEDEHEAERDQGIEHAGDEAVPQRLRQQIGRLRHLHEGVEEDHVEHMHRMILNAPRRDRRRSPPDCS